MLLERKYAVIYGAGGAIGSAVAKVFAREGAHVFLAGRRLATVEPLAREIRAAGGRAEAAQVDALDEQAVTAHLEAIVGKVGGIDVLFNAVGIPNTKVQGVPMTDLAVDQFSQPITTLTRSYFLTARLAARRMLPKKCGVIMTVSALPSRTGIPLLGGFAPAQAAVDALTRSLSAEWAPQGIRVLGLRPDAMPETSTIKEVFDIHAKAWGMSWQQFHDVVAGKNHLRRLLTLAELAEVAAFAASDKAGGLTGTVLNLSAGALDD